MDYCFDTSAINQLHDDPHRDEIVAGLLAANRVFVSELNLVEVMTTAITERRLSLCALLKRLTRGNMPLLTPTVLLRNLTLAHASNQPSTAITSDETTPEAWLALQQPEKFLDEDSRQGFYKEKQDIENRFSNVHRRARQELPGIFPDDHLPGSFGQTLRFFSKTPLSYFSLAAALYEGVTGATLTLDQMLDLFRDLPEWPLFLAGWAQGLYARALQAENFSARKNVGTIDLWFAVYLEHCDFLVTADFLQFQALRVIKHLATRRQPRARVLLYRQFRKRLVL